MNKRQKELLRILLVNANHFQNIGDLHVRLHCAEKTVRNDCDVIEKFLATYEDATLLRKRGKGISLQLSQKTQTTLFQDLFHSASQTEEERVIEIAYQLLTSTTPVTIKELAAHYYTHATQIKEDISTIEKWLTRFNLYIQTKQRIGSVINGTELNKRSAIAHLSELVVKDKQRDYVLDFFPVAERNAVNKALRDMQRQYGLEWTDGGFESLLIHALIMISRTRQHSPVPVSHEDTEKMMATKVYAITNSMLEKLEAMLRMTFPKNERIYFSWHVSSSIRNKEQVMESYHSSEFAQNVVQQLTQNVEQLTLIQFHQDKILADGLIVHMDAVLKRMSHGFHITNPMLHDIKKMYPYLFSMIVFALNGLRDTQKINIPEEEAAYLVLHFQASIERMEQEREPKKVLIICHMGIGMSRLLQAKLEQQYKDLTMVGCIAKNELQDFLKHTTDIDLIISTVPLPQQKIPHVVISPLLEAKDKTRLNQFIQEGKKQPTSRSYKTLLHYIKQGFFQHHIAVNHPFKVVEMLANQLVRLNLVEPTFTHQALLRERVSFTSIGGGIAIPHAEPETVKKTTITMAILQEPLTWGEEYVSIVFLLAITKDDQTKTKDIMKEISALSEQPQLVTQITQASQKQDVLDILS